MITLKIGQKIPLAITRMGINGEGIGFYKRRLVFVPYALPTEEVYVEITENAKNFSRAKIVNIKKHSEDRVKPMDQTYWETSSSHIMHLKYEKQLEFKRDILEETLRKYKPEGYENYELRPTIGMANTTRYRYKLQYQVRKLSNGRVIAGLYKEGTHHLQNFENCLVQEELTQKIANKICDLVEKFNIPVYDERKIQGLRTMMIRRSRKTGDVQVILISSKEQNYDRVISALIELFPEIVTVASNLQTSKSSQIYGDYTDKLWGDKDGIVEGVLDYDFELSPRAFYQLNPEQANILYDEAVTALEPKKDDRVIDAYCGVGSIGFAVAKKVKSVHGMDVVPEAIEDARFNAERLGFKNCHYETGRAEKIIPSWYKSGHRPTALLVDPPRTGLDEKLLETIVEYQPEKMVYVSCNTSTLAKDLVVLAKYYNVEYIQSVDMFPHTARTEAVVKLRKK